MQIFHLEKLIQKKRFLKNRLIKGMQPIIWLSKIITRFFYKEETTIE